MEPFIWMWLSDRWRDWPRQLRLVPEGASVICRDARGRNAALALAVRLGRSDLRAMTFSDVREIMAHWKLKLLVKGTVCVGDAEGTLAPRAGILGQRRPVAAGVRDAVSPPGGNRHPGGFAGSAARLDSRREDREVARPAAIFHGTRNKPVWLRSELRRRGELRRRAMAGVVTG